MKNNFSITVLAKDLLDNSRFNPKFFFFKDKANKLFKSNNFDKVIDFSNKEFFKKVTDGIHSTVNLKDKGSIRYLYIHNLKEGFIDSVDKLFLDENDHELNKSKELKDGLVLVSVVGTIGNTAIFCNQNEEKCSLPRNIAFIETTGKLDSHYIVLFFLSDFGKEQAVMNAGGNIQGLLSLGKFKKMKIPILKEELSRPLIKKYKQSLEIESKALSLIENAKKEFYNEIDIDFDEIKKKMSFSVESNKFLRFDFWTPEFANPLYENIILELSKKHKLVKLVDIKDKIITFKEPGSDFYLNCLNKSKDDYPFIRTSDFFNYELDPNPDYFIEDTTGKDFYKPLINGDIVITKDGKIGNVAIIFETKNYILSAGSIILRLKKNINPYYIFLCLVSSDIGQNFFQKNTVIASTIPHLKITRLEEIKIPLLSIQKMDILGKIIKKAYKLKSQRRILMSDIKDKINYFFSY